MRRFLFCLLVACGPARVATPAAVETPRRPSVQIAESGPSHAERGVLDVAAEELRVAWEKDKTDAAKKAYGRALVDAWAFERARAVLGDDPSIPQGDLHAIEPDGDRVGRAIRALAAHDPKTAASELAPEISPRAQPLVLELAGRAAWSLGQHVEARKLWARARSRIDAAGGQIGLVATAAGAVSALDAADGRILAARTRERYLVGGYQSSGTQSDWIETYAPGDPDPLIRIPTGSLAGFALARDGKTAAVAERPVDLIAAPVPETARLFDVRTGRTEASWGVQGVDALAFFGDALLASRDHDVTQWDSLGRVARTFPIVGSTAGAMRIYRAGRGTMHDTFTAMYPSEPIGTEARDGAIAIASSDGTIWVWTKGATSPVALRPPGTAHDEHEALGRRAVAMQFDSSARTLRVVTGDGAIVSWDVARQRARIIAEPKCTPDEFATGLFGSAPTPDVLADCARTPKAWLSPDGSRAILTRGLGGPRVRDAVTGAPVTTFDMLSSDALAWAGPTTAWVGGVDGAIARFDATTGERTAILEQGGVRGYMQAVSSDGRYVAVAGVPVGLSEKAKAVARIWDTTEHRVVGGLPADFASADFVDRGVALVYTKRGAFLWDLATRQHVADFDAPDEKVIAANVAVQRVVSANASDSLVVRDFRRVVRRIALGGSLFQAAFDRDMHEAAAVIASTGDLVVWSLDDGRELLRRSAALGGPGVALSPDGKLVAWRADRKTLLVASIADNHELARLSSSDLAPNRDYGPLQAFAFASEDEVLVVGPGKPGYERVYRWKIGGKATPTEVQVLTGERIVIGAGVAVVYDRNDTAHLLRIADGALLASVYAAGSGGFFAMSRRGAVDASPEGRSAAVTIATGSARAGGSSWLAWDRFAVPGLLTRAARGEMVAPPIVGFVERSESLR
ncbi:MAG TPA: WD40 repeat domain-containing protein [Polyangiaceae bacterium]|jgi:hypothetical protein